MNAFENWLKSNEPSGEDQTIPDPNQTIAGVQARIQRRKTRRRLAYSITTAATIVLVLIFTMDRTIDSSTPETLSANTESNLFDVSLVQSLLDSSDVDELYWSATEYIIGMNNLNQPLPEIQFTETEIEAFTEFLKEQNS
ncbi:MAG: hypothetical protein K9N34_04990 [Candidatus Marinimicrobia bacterium]|nr:hypothetical protein [Candidatus Neomarinimicrobiota bacterium]MCF7839922.1 hypothetical protein [Candidatus Neomarinimicrobiota bacterium]MCF7901999.1 hypothetical protein [Candidatus Neomarinimicrobiota bacterium]